MLVILLTRMKTRGLLRDTIHLSIGQGFRLVIQAAYFVLIARSLGPDAYGAFVTVVAMAALLGPFSGLGTANLFIKNVRSSKREAAICWGNGILLTVFSGSLLSALGLGLSLVLHLKTAPLVVIDGLRFRPGPAESDGAGGIRFYRPGPDEANLDPRRGGQPVSARRNCYS